MILKKTRFWLETYGNQKATVLGDWLMNFLIRTRNKEEQKVARNWLGHLVVSGKPRTLHSCAVQPGAVADWWCSLSMANMLPSLSLSQRRTFWTCDSVFFCTWWTLFHTMLDAAGVVLRVHYTSIKCDLSFSQGNISMIFRWGGHFSYMCKKCLLVYNSAKIIKSIEFFQSYDHKCTATFLMVHSVFTLWGKKMHLFIFCSNCHIFLYINNYWYMYTLINLEQSDIKIINLLCRESL